MQRKKLVSLIGLVLIISIFTVIYVFVQKSLNVRKQQVEEIKMQVLELLEKRQFDEVVKLGEPAVPALIEIVRNGEYEFPMMIVHLLAKIGDEKAIPLLSDCANLPSSGDYTGQAYVCYDSGAGKWVLKVWDGSAWQQVG